jgi:hypothetical protein
MDRLDEKYKKGEKTVNAIERQLEEMKKKSGGPGDPKAISDLRSHSPPLPLSPLQSEPEPEPEQGCSCPPPPSCARPWSRRRGCSSPKYLSCTCPCHACCR